ncbi:hypothetical protein OE88DRAFT_1811253 [Heliocybe sulcata]|uniref:BTB domain-containing protein n=1 Tax=Heliocybe sulcata TaxID=5364 RepID=A0A5C3MSP4_9AGAM|nr:hypothetical protein OE88DRAFT_1811253 [Heliocybe sulcata]
METLYYLLSAEDASGGRILFRVHRSVLAKLSSVFADMFSLPSNDAANEMYDGAFLVDMPDPADALESLLRVIYHETNLVFQRLSPDTPHKVKPILALCNKYDIPSIRERIVSRLEEDWPRTLNEWDALEAEIEEMQKDLHDSHDCDAYNHNCDLTNFLPEPVSAINLAVDCDVPSILPAAFYQLMRSSPSYPRYEYLALDEGDNQDLASERDDYVSDGGRLASWQDLSADNHYRLHLGRERINEAIYDRLSLKFVAWKKDLPWSSTQLLTFQVPTCRRP